jgi:hypothetical protein
MQELRWNLGRAIYVLKRRQALKNQEKRNYCKVIFRNIRDPTSCTILTISTKGKSVAPYRSNNIR